MELSAKYDPSQVEDKWYAYWLKNKFSIRNRMKENHIL